jgi:hypothetical protein
MFLLVTDPPFKVQHRVFHNGEHLYGSSRAATVQEQSYALKHWAKHVIPAKYSEEISWQVALVKTERGR